jgi:putative tryptophan/tyrosine transport system substrate-binding protein
VNQKTARLSISPYDIFAPAGGLLSYSAVSQPLARKAADYVALILNGAKPPDLPVIQATVINLVINLKTAKAIGVTIPSSLLAQAAEIIQ